MTTFIRGRVFLVPGFLWLLASQAVQAESPSEAQARPGRAIYRCRIAGVNTFSDHPCGESVEEYDAGIGRLSILDSPPAAARTAERVAKKASTVHNTPVHNASVKPPRDEQAVKANACQRSQQVLHKIHNQMRTGYSAKRGERLRDRKRDLEEQRRTLGC
jgi:hypothetical protein